MTVTVRVPTDRIGVIIGPGGETRKLLSERSGFPISVDSEANEVSFEDQTAGADPLMALKLRDVLRALGRGFSPEHAFRLFNDDVYFELLDIHEYVGKNKTRMRQVAARIIGSEGKTRRIIEEQTGCHLAIYGHTVGIIGELEELGNAKRACDMILRGAEHSSVYGFLESKRRSARQSDSALWKS